jgi:hypothetical protein
MIEPFDASADLSSRFGPSAQIKFDGLNQRCCFPIPSCSMLESGKFPKWETYEARYKLTNIKGPVTCLTTNQPLPAKDENGIQKSGGRKRGTGNRRDLACGVVEPKHGNCVVDADVDEVIV